MPHRRYTLKALRLRNLMPYRVTEVLLVSSPYDAFILEQDGQLTEQVFREYRDLSLPAAPRFTHATTGEAAMGLLEERHFDLVLTMTSLADMDVNAFGRRVKARRAEQPVVLLALDRRALHDLRRTIDRTAIDGAFLWNGDSKILLALIKYVEDRKNVDHDIAHGVRVIVVVEDSARYYSAFLGLLYKELVKQAQALYAGGVNEFLRQMYMSSRPKILLATSYEDGAALLDRYRESLLSLISDVRVPRGDELDPTAGLGLVRLARRVDDELPVLLQSADSEHATAAKEIGTAFLDKSSPGLLGELRDFLTHSLGFGDFVFRTADGGGEIARARGLGELEEKLAEVPDESIVYHARHNHFSIWLMARSEFELAERIRPQKISDFDTLAELRAYLVQVLREGRRATHRGVISDFRRHDDVAESFTRLGMGSVGGKARGIAFLNLRLADMSPADFGGLTVRLPRTAVIATEAFDRFLDENELRKLALAGGDDREIRRRFLAGRLPGKVTDDLRFLLGRLEGPLAVRSSSLLEDSMHQPLAGIYSTLMLPNSAAAVGERLRQVADAVKLVYASTFLDNARSYLETTGNRIEEEKMAVIVQELVGRRHGPRFYPTFSGVAQSYNFYPIGPQKPEEGIVHLALGLGRQVVDGGQALRFSPRHPEVLPQLDKPKVFLDRSQRGFWALDMSQDCCDPEADLYSSVRWYELDDAEEDGTLQVVGSVYSADDRRIRDDLSHDGPRLVTFNNVLRHKAIPLATAISKLLEVGKEGLGCAVEIELACEMGDWGRFAEAGRERQEPELHLLQIRPFAGHGWSTVGVPVELDPEDLLCASAHALGHGVERNVRDVVYVRADRWRAGDNRAIAEEVDGINRELRKLERPYLLIGPGRWGTADEWLGIPVRWSQISNVKVIVEASPAGYEVEPSQGTHFFQNITSLEIGYLALAPGAPEKPDGDEHLDRQWLDAQPARAETDHLRWLELEEPLTVVLDGRHRRGVIALPGAEPRSPT